VPSRLRDLWNALPVPLEYVAVIGAGLAANRLDRRRLPTALRPLGAAFLANGIVLNVQATIGRWPGDLENPTRLVTDGPHAWTRNPMYVGWSELHLGLALLLRSPWLLAAWPAMFVPIHRVVLGEERMLEQRFGAAYDDYRRRVPRYLPHPGPTR
jgi:protein-S-isoprenylcysteine O-methyltransferase Ste14